MKVVRSEEQLVTGRNVETPTWVTSFQGMPRTVNVRRCRLEVVAGVDAGNATLPAFTHVAGNTTIMKATVISDRTRNFDSDTVSQLRSDLSKKSGFPVSVELNTMVEVQIGKIKTKKIGIRVTCEGIKGFQPKNASSKTPTPGTTSDAKCKVDLRIKIWKFTF